MNANELREQVKRYEDNKDFIENEETAKMALVVPFIRLLGYDPNSPREVRLEYRAPFVQGDGKKFADRMDFAIFDKSGSKPLMVIETKPLGTDLQAKSQQLARYIAQLPDLHFGIITDGCHYLFFGDLENENQMDKDPFFTFSLEDSKTDWAKVAKFLSKFSRDSFNAETLVTDAENSRYRQAMIDKLTATLRTPADDEDFLRWLTNDIYKGKRTSAVMSRLGEIAKEAIEPALLRIMGDDFVDKLRKRIELLRDSTDSKAKLDEMEEESEDSGSGEQTQQSEPRRGIETTHEELEFFGIVQTMCSEAGYDSEEIVYKDTTHYFNVSYSKPTKWFVRLFSGGRRMNITTPLPLDEAIGLAPDYNVEEAPSAFGLSRIYVDDLTQMGGLSSLILRSLEAVKGG